MRLQLDIGQRSDVGRRREHNEDSLGVYRPDDAGELDRRGLLLLVADGMGGYAAGEVASRVAIETVSAEYFGDPSGDIEDALGRALAMANEAVRDEATRNAERAGMGTTIAAAAICQGQIAAANVGDSRVYVCRGGTLRQITHDHSWVAELMAAGKLTAEEAKRHPMRNVVTRSLGGRADVEVETYPLDALFPGDIVVVCSDGLWGMIGGDQIQDIIEPLSAQAAADALVAAANEAGGHDNISAIVCRIFGEDDDEGERTELIETMDLEDFDSRDTTSPDPITPPFPPR
jgi:PPM family protein phosphatase